MSDDNETQIYQLRDNKLQGPVCLKGTFLDVSNDSKYVLVTHGQGIAFTACQSADCFMLFQRQLISC